MDRKLSKLQNFSLDAAGPLVMALEEATRDDGIHDMDLITSCIQQALLSLGNTSAHFSHERRVKALSSFNPDLKTLVVDGDFTKAAPWLFSEGIKQNAKARKEVVECLRKASSSGSQAKQPFRSTRSYRSGYGNHHHTPYYQRGGYQKRGPGARNAQPQGQGKKS